MRHLTLFTCLFSLSLAHAQNVRVTKVAGKKAIVVRESGPPLKVGMVLNADGSSELSENDLESNSGGGSGAGKRDNTLGGSASISTTSTSTSPGNSKTSSTNLALTGFYGWNAKTMEYGPRFTLSRSSTKVGSSSSSTTTFGIGGFFDYNFSPNVPGKEMIYALGTTLDYLRNSTSGGSSATSTTTVFIGPALKWFPLKNAVAVRADAGLDYSRSSVGSVTTTSTSFLVRAGLQVYF